MDFSVVRFFTKARPAWPIYAGNHLELGWPYYDSVRRWMPESRRDPNQVAGGRDPEVGTHRDDGHGATGFVTAAHPDHQPRSTHSSRWGRSVPIVVSRP